MVNVSADVIHENKKYIFCLKIFCLLTHLF
jgi:hypothetical protein